MAIADDALWPRASAWLAAGTGHELGVVGVPLNRSVSPCRYDEGPTMIREALYRFSVHHCESGTDLRNLGVRDHGDLQADNESATRLLREVVSTGSMETIWAFLGGDNGVTYAGVQSLAFPLDRVGLITFDAHHDVRHLDNGLHNGNPVRALIEAGLPGRNVVQIGIQSFANSPEYAAYCHLQGIRVVTTDQLARQGLHHFLPLIIAEWSDQFDALYVDFDLDVLDRSYVPGCPGARPGGLRPGELQDAAFLLGRCPQVRAADFVEINRGEDVHQLTALNTAAVLLHFAAGVASRRPRS